MRLAMTMMMMAVLGVAVTMMAVTTVVATVVIATMMSVGVLVANGICDNNDGNDGVKDFFSPR